MSWSVTLGGQAKNTARLLLETLPSVLLTDRSDPRVVTDALTLALFEDATKFQNVRNGRVVAADDDIF
jgi:hypothetical protein